MMIIGKTLVGTGRQPFIVAEISGNHGGDINKALDLIRAAAAADADAVKFQCYEPDDLTIDSRLPDFIIKNGLWKGRSLYELYSKACTPYNWFPRLFDYAKEHKIIPLSSVFSKRGVDHLEKLGCPAYKIASMEIVDIPLIQYAASTNKPLIISTGMATESDIVEAMSAAQHKAIPLHCVSGYPTPVEESCLIRLRDLKRNWVNAGLSDHSRGSIVPIAAVALGACIVEKHLCMSKKDKTEDVEFSMTPAEFHQMVQACRMTYRAMREAKKSSEQASLQLRRSLYAVEDIKSGEPLTENNVRSIRPSYGLSPKYLSTVIGRLAKTFIPKGTPLSMEFFE